LDNDVIEGWEVDSENSQLVGVVKNDAVCKHINNIEHGRPLEMENPGCDELVEGSSDTAYTCCEEANP